MQGRTPKNRGVCQDGSPSRLETKRGVGLRLLLPAVTAGREVVGRVLNLCSSHPCVFPAPHSYGRYPRPFRTMVTHTLCVLSPLRSVPKPQASASRRICTTKQTQAQPVRRHEYSRPRRPVDLTVLVELSHGCCSAGELSVSWLLHFQAHPHLSCHGCIVGYLPPPFLLFPVLEGLDTGSRKLLVGHRLC